MAWMTVGGHFHVAAGNPSEVRHRCEPIDSHPIRVVTERTWEILTLPQ